MKRLFITRAKSRFLFGERQMTAQSRFLGELADKLGLKPPKPVQPYREKSRYDDSGYYPDDVFTPSSAGVATSNFAKSFVTKKPAFKSKAKSATVDESTYKIGKHVKHLKFGIGTIVDVKQTAGRTIADVAFKGLGVKSFAVALAPMEVID